MAMTRIEPLGKMLGANGETLEAPAKSMHCANGGVKTKRKLLRLGLICGLRSLPVTTAEAPGALLPQHHTPALQQACLGCGVIGLVHLAIAFDAADITALETGDN
jgi:hypothetical protein